MQLNTCATCGDAVGAWSWDWEDDFPTEALATRLAVAKCIEYEGEDVAAQRAAAANEALGKGRGYVGRRREKGDSDSDDDSDEF